MPDAGRRCCYDGPPEMDSDLCGRRSRSRNCGIDARGSRSSYVRDHGRSKLRIAVDYCFKCFKMAFRHKKRDHDRVDLLDSSFPLPNSEPYGTASVETSKEAKSYVAVSPRATAPCDISESVNACEGGASDIISEGYDWRLSDTVVASVDGGHHQRTQDEWRYFKTEAGQLGHTQQCSEGIHINDCKETAADHEKAVASSSAVSQIGGEEDRYDLIPDEGQESFDIEEECNGASSSGQDGNGNEEFEGNSWERSFNTYKEDDIWSDEALISCQVKGFPPPISILANESHPGLPSNVQRTLWRSVKRGGRFVLQEVQACPEEFFQATREHGRLRLQLVRSDSESVDSLDNPLGVGAEVENSDSTSAGTESTTLLDAEARHFAGSTIEETHIRASDLDQSPAKHIDAGVALEPSFTQGNPEEEEDDTFIGYQDCRSERSVANPGMDCEHTSSNSSNIDLGAGGSILGHMENNISQMCALSSLQLSKTGNENHMVENKETVIGMSVVALHPEVTRKAELSGNNKMAIPSGAAGDSEQFKQDCQHVHYSSSSGTYGFDSSVTISTLSPNQAFYQFPIQPVR